MSEVGPADRSRLLRSKQEEQSSILSTRKRKFSQFFAAAAAQDSLPSHEFANPNASKANPNDLKSYDHSDLLQGKKFGDGNLSNAPLLAYSGVLRFFTSSGLWTCRPDAQPRPVADVNGRATSSPSTQQSAASQSPVPIAPAPTDEKKRQDVAQSAAPRGAPAAPPVATQAKEGKKLKPSGPSPLLPTAPLPASPSQALEAKENGIPATTATAPKPPSDSRTPTATPTPPDQTAKPVPEASERESPPRAVAGQEGTREDAASPPKPPLSPVSSALPGPVTEAPSTKPPDSGRPHDAVSSPTSTAASAATPAVQDISAVTSPDKEEARVAGGKGESTVNGDVSMTDVPSLGAGVTQGEVVTRPPPAPAAPDAKDAKDVKDAKLPQAHERPSPPTPLAASTTPPSATREAAPAALPTLAPKGPEVSKPPTPPAETSEAIPSAPDTTTPTPPKTTQDVAPSVEPMDVDKPSVEEADKENEPVAPTIESKPPTPAQRARSPTSETPPLERAVTRVSSGAMRQKSVSEILGRSSRSQSSDRGAVTKGSHGYMTSASLAPRNKASLAKQKGKGRKQVSTVVFGKPPKRSDDKTIGNGKQHGTSPADDYFTPLFIEGFVSRSNWMKPLGALLNQAHKTISSSDAYLAYEDDQACKILRRVYQLQHGNKWSLRQLDRCPEPTRPPSHTDVLLQEMKWMRTDFREERKWKIATAKIMAHACAAWHAASPEERIQLQVPAVSPPKPAADGAAEAENDAAAPLGKPDRVSDQVAPGLMSDNLAVLPQDEGGELISPAAIFALPEDQAVFALRESPTSDLLLSELPLYGSPLKVPGSDVTQPDYDPDAHWRRPALPLSKFVEGDMKLVTDGQPTWQSKFIVDEESEDEDMEKYQSSPATRRRNWLPPESSDVALFNPEMKSIRDRLHASHQFRPPTEHLMPPQSFYENRVASQWTGGEDEELRRIVGQYSYNWTLISDVLTMRSSFTSGAERRTAWECFERWLQLEPLSPDLAKTQYFRAYNHRIDNAQRVIMQQHQAAQQQATANGQPPPKRRQCVPVRVERRNNRRHINLLSAMSKVAKKREATAQKQQAQSTMIAMRKANETQQQPRPQHPLKTPRDYSLMRWERDQAMAEKMAQYAQRQEAQKRAALQARQAQASMAPNSAATAAGSGGQVPQNQGAQQAGGNGIAGMPRANMPNQFGMAQARPGMPLQGAAGMNGLGGVPSHLAANLARQMPINGVPQGQAQGMQGQHRVQTGNQQADAHIIMQAQRISEQQRATVQMQHQGQPQQAQASPTPQPQHSPTPGQVLPQVNHGRQGSPNVRLNGVNQQNFMANAQALMAQFGGGANGASALNALQNAGLHAPAGSPRPQMSALTNHIAVLETQFRQKNPNATPEHARTWATEQLGRIMLAQRTAMSQQAMNAAAGSVTPQGMSNGPSPAQYAAMLRQQQQQQAQVQAQAQAQAQAQQQGSPLQQQAMVSTPQSLSTQHQRTPSGSATPGK